MRTKHSALSSSRTPRALASPAAWTRSGRRRALGDDDQERSLQRAHRLWWNSGLDRHQSHNAMKAARHGTLARMANGQVGGRPTADFFGVKAGAAADQCVRAGLQVPRG
jgi:hypothetical protein